MALPDNVILGCVEGGRNEQVTTYLTIWLLTSESVQVSLLLLD